MAILCFFDLASLTFVLFFVAIVSYFKNIQRSSGVFQNRHVLAEASREREQTQLNKRMFEFHEFQLVTLVT